MQIWRDLSADGWIRKDGGLVVVRQILCDAKTEWPLFHILYIFRSRIFCCNVTVL